MTIELDRDIFTRTLIRKLAGTLETVIGRHEAEGYISLVSAELGGELSRDYAEESGVARMDRDQVIAALIDLKRRIKGDFHLIEADDDRIVLGNHACPFAESVLGRPSMCMMTSNVFGVIAAQNLGYARVTLEETISAGAPRCRVAIDLQPGGRGGREYFRADED